MHFGATDWMAFLMILAISFIYLALMHSVALFVSCRSEQSSTAISVLLFVWVIFVLIVPNFMPYLAAILRPIDPPATIQERVAAVWARVSRKFWDDVGKQRPQRNDPNFDWGAWWSEREKQRDAEYAQERNAIIGPYKRERAEFSRLAQGLSRLSPLACYTYAATRLAQTGPEQEPRMEESLERLRLGLGKLEIELRARRVKARSRDGEGLNLDILPRFQFEWQGLGERIAAVGIDAALLMAGCVIFFLGTYVSFLRMDLVA